MTRKDSMKNRLPAMPAFGIAMTLAFVFALVLDTPALAQGTPTVSKTFAKPLKEAQDAMKARKYDAAMAKLKEIQGMPGKSPYDEHLMHEMMGFLYFRANDFAAAARELEPGLNSGFLKPGNASLYFTASTRITMITALDKSRLTLRSTPSWKSSNR